MQPTPENMTAYLEANTYVLKKGQVFADMWRRTVWANPEYDFNVQNPSANFAQVQLKQARAQSARTAALTKKRSRRP